MFQQIMNFNGFDFTKYFVIEEIRRNPLNVNNTFVKGTRYPDRFIYNRPEAKTIEVKMRYLAPKGADRLIHTIAAGETISSKNASSPSVASILYTDEPKKLILGDRPRHYDLCVVDGEVTRDDFAYTSLYTVKFLSPYPWSFGSEERVTKVPSTGKDVINFGNVDVYPTIVIPSNTSSSFTIQNEATGETFQFLYGLSGMTITIDNENLTVSTPGISGYERNVALESNWIHLAPGKNHITSNGTGPLEFHFHEQYLG